MIDTQTPLRPSGSVATLGGRENADPGPGISSRRCPSQRPTQIHFVFHFLFLRRLLHVLFLAQLLWRAGTLSRILWIDITGFHGR